jgi:Xaa-Pro aminopeptidase
MIRNEELLTTLKKFIEDNKTREYAPYVYYDVPNFSTLSEYEGLYFWYYKASYYLQGIEVRAIVYNDRQYDDEDKLVSKNLQLFHWGNEIMTPITVNWIEKEFRDPYTKIFSDIRDAADYFYGFYCDPNRKSLEEKLKE